MKDNLTVRKDLSLASKVRQAIKNGPRIFLSKLQISESDFLVNENSNADFNFSLFRKSSFVCTVNHLSISPKLASNTLYPCYKNLCPSAVTLLVDSPSVTCPQKILNGTLTEHLINHHGEADYAMWHHAIHSTTSNILIVSADTDT